MKEHPSNQKKAVSRANANQPFFQKKSEQEPFFKPEGSENSFFSKRVSFFPPPLNFNPTQVQRKKNESLPEELQTNMENSFEQDFSNVKVQKNSQGAVDLNARAFTKGDSIHFAPGEFNPNSEQGKNLIGHEFTHVAQQRSGVVKPTRVMGKGLNINDDKELESEADNFGKKAAKGESIPKYQLPNIESRNGIRNIQAKRNVVQLAKHPSHYGDWFDDTYSISKATGQHSIKMDLRFDPNDKVDAELIGLSQTVRSVKNNNAYYINNNKTIKSHSIQPGDAIELDPATKETDEGAHIDQHSQYKNPLYATGASSATDTLETTPTPEPKDWGEHGYHYKAGKVWKDKEPHLHDETGLNNADKSSGQFFETTALALKGNQKGTYYGSVQWGWRTDSKGKFTKIPFKVVSQGTPSSTFMKSAEIWNASKTSGGKDTLNLPIIDVKVVTGNPITLLPPPIPQIGVAQNTTLPVGTRLQVIRPWHPPMAANANGEVRVVDGPHVGKQGEVSSQDWANIADERN